MRLLSILLACASLAFGQGQFSGTGQGQGTGQLAILPVPPQFTLTVTVSGGGSVSGSPNGNGNVPISCPAQCSANYNVNTIVTLSESANGGNSFGGWSGACAGSSSSCVVTMSAAQSVTASFTGSGCDPNNKPCSYATRTDACAYNRTYIASCAGDASCAAICNPLQAAGKSNALLTFTNNSAD